MVQAERQGEVVLMAKDFEREELIELRERALNLSRGSSMNASWCRLYIALADAADNLDAFNARSGALVEDPV